MTKEEAIARTREQLLEARAQVARVVGVPILVTIEASGYRVVPEWMADLLIKVLEKGS